MHWIKKCLEEIQAYPPNWRWECVGINTGRFSLCLQDFTFAESEQGSLTWQIPARLVQDAEAELAPSITYLINKSITDGTVPTLWKAARVTPLHKAKDKLLVDSYRSISVLPVLSKVLERVVHTQLNAYLDHLGFLKSISTVLGTVVIRHMLFYLYIQSIWLYKPQETRRKASKKGISGRTLRWFKSYLADRRQCVCA